MRLRGSANLATGLSGCRPLESCEGMLTLNLSWQLLVQEMNRWQSGATGRTCKTVVRKKRNSKQNLCFRLLGSSVMPRFMSAFGLSRAVESRPVCQCAFRCFVYQYFYGTFDCLPRPSDGVQGSERQYCGRSCSMAVYR